MRAWALAACVLALLPACSDSGSDSGSGSDSAAATELPEPTDPAFPGEWREGSEADESMWRTEVGAAAFDGRIWLAGGFAHPGGQRVADVLIYDPAADTWSRGPALPEAVDHASLVNAGGRLHLLGGHTDIGPSDRVWVLEDPASPQWTAGPLLPGPRGAGAAAWDGTRLVFAGGVADHQGTIADDVFVLEGGEWRRLGALQAPRDHLAAASDEDGRVWFLAGRQGSFETNQQIVDLVEGEAVAALGEVPTARGGVAGFHVPGVGGCVAGGEEASTFAEVECIDADGTVTELPDLPQSRHGLGTVVLDGSVYALLGGPVPGLAFSGTVQILDLP